MRRERSKSSRDSSSRRGSRGDTGGATRARKRGFEYQRRTADQLDKREQSADSRESIYKVDVKLFQPAKGDNCIRILPPTWKNADHFGIDVYVHYGIGPDDSAYICPKAMGKGDCPICEERKAAVADGDDDYVKQLNYSRRVLYYLLDREDSDSLMVWTAPFISFDKVLTAQTRDKKTGEILYIDDPEDGYDVEFTKEGEKIKTKYTGVRIARHSSPIGRGRAVDNILNSITENPLPDILDIKSYDKLNEVFNGSSKSGKASKKEASDSSITSDDIMELDHLDDLAEIIEEFNLKLDADDYTEDDIEDFQDDIISELGLE